MKKLSFRKGQQALEYLVTYGWAFVIVILTIGAFAYFGILNPQQYIPDRCDFGVQMQCADYILYSAESGTSPGQVHLKILNGYGVPIEIVGISTSDGSGESRIGTDPAPTSNAREFKGTPLAVGEGEISEIIVLDLINSDYALADGDKASVPVAITFRQETPTDDAPTHTVLGEVFASAQDAAITNN